MPTDHPVHDPGPAFRALHVPGNPFILANAWDVGSAQMLAARGAQALATSSAAFAFTIGRRDMGDLTRDQHLAHAETIVAATPLPVQGDFENGFGPDPETCADTVRLSAEIGLAGICIEDTALPDSTAYAFDHAVERIRAAAAAARALPQDFFLVARADGLLAGGYGQDEALRRIKAFAEAGADGVYAPMPASSADLAALIKASDKPFNALAAGRFSKLTLAQFAKMGAARVSLGSALARVTHKAIDDAAKAMLQAGDFSMLARGMSGDTVDDLLTAGRKGEVTP